MGSMQQFANAASWTRLLLEGPMMSLLLGTMPATDLPAVDGSPKIEGEAAIGLELAELLTSGVYLGMGVPRGFGRRVLVVPGFLGSDEYLRPLRGWLQRIGYQPSGSGIAFNVGTPSVLIRNLMHRIEALMAEPRAPQGRLVIIGHSLGGIFARALLVKRPDLVSHAICMGSPIHGDPRAASHPFVARL